MQSEEIGQLITAIGAVMADVGYVRGTGYNSSQRYNFTSDEDLAAAVQPALVKHGVSLSPLSADVTPCDFSTSKGTPMNRVIISQPWRVAHTSGQWMTVETVGEGADSMDKSVTKALTSGRKYLLRLLFCIPTGDDIEREAAVAQSNAAQIEFSPFVSDLLDRVEALQRKGTPNAGAAAAKLLKGAKSGLSDDDLRTSLAKLIQWVEASEAGE